MIPAQGSVGASGDLAPLAHMAAVMMGEGEAASISGTRSCRRSKRPCRRLAGLTPIVLGPKEGLALINGTQFSTACALGGLVRRMAIWRHSSGGLVTAALSTDAIMGSTAPLQPGDPRDCAAIAARSTSRAQCARTACTGRKSAKATVIGDTPSAGSLTAFAVSRRSWARRRSAASGRTTLEIEANAATDNPLVLTDDGRDPVSGGNFHAEPVAFAADQIALAVAEIGAIAQRRVALMVDPTLSFDLPPFLTPDPGLNSGLMIAEVTTAALMSENKHLANPCSTDSTPTSANQEDHVSMAAHGARRLARMTANLTTILGVEAAVRRAGHRTARAADHLRAACRRSWPACADRSRACSR